MKNYVSRDKKYADLSIINCGSILKILHNAVKMKNEIIYTQEKMEKYNLKMVFNWVMKKLHNCTTR